MAANIVFQVDRQLTAADYSFLERVFQKMLLNFSWWVNRKDPMEKNIFQGFLGMDNIRVFDRDHRLASSQADGRLDGGICQNMLSIALASQK